MSLCCTRTAVGSESVVVLLIAEGVKIASRLQGFGGCGLPSVDGQGCDSNVKSCDSSIHCRLAFSLLLRKFRHVADGVCAVLKSDAHSFTGMKFRASLHKLAPEMNACSRLVRAIFFNCA